MAKNVSVIDVMNKKGREKLVMVTSYDFTMTRIIDSTDVDMILVGDSSNTVMAGGATTLGATMDSMVYHTRCVMAAKPRALVVADLPFLSYQPSNELAVLNAGRLLQEAGAGSVKLEGGLRQIERVRAIIAADIPVMGHLGLTPQSVNAFGGHRVQGRGDAAARRILDDALALEEAGVFAIVLECVPEPLAAEITSQLRIPTIGIGAGNVTDGQVLVIQDLLGMFQEFRPKFVKPYANLFETISGAVSSYASEVRSGAFPDPEHTFKE
jgi:3-methyl-2-oxobutanoate hydroxymethyltransferase